MARRTPDVPDKIFEAAESSWSKWRREIPTSPRTVDPATLRIHTRHLDPDAAKSPEQQLIEKIRRRMREYPEWYETRPEAVSEVVSARLDAIGTILAREMPVSDDPVEVWQIPLSVFNWLEDGPEGEVFHRGALLAWSSAEKFNDANAPGLDEAERARLRQPFLELSPLLLRAVLEELLQTGLWVSFAEKFVGNELQFLVLRVQRPIDESG